MYIKTVKKAAITIFGMVVLFSSCDKEDPITSADTSQETISYFATVDNINGELVNADLNLRGELSADLNQDTFDGYQALNIRGVNEGNKFMDIYVSKENKLSEAYSVGSHTIDLFAIGEIVYVSSSSSLELTTSDAGSHTISGTFEFEGKERGGSRTISLTNGVFTNVKYDVDFYQ